MSRGIERGLPPVDLVPAGNQRRRESGARCPHDAAEACGRHSVSDDDLEWDPAQVAITAGEVYDQLVDGEPRIMSHASGDGYSFRVRPPAIRPGDQTLAGRRIADVLRKAPKGVTKKTLTAPAADLAGRWDVECSTAGARLATNCCWSRAETAWKAVTSADDSRAPSAGR